MLQLQAHPLHPHISYTHCSVQLRSASASSASKSRHHIGKWPGYAQYLEHWTTPTARPTTLQKQTISMENCPNLAGNMHSQTNFATAAACGHCHRPQSIAIGGKILEGKTTWAFKERRASEKQARHSTIPRTRLQLLKAMTLVSVTNQYPERATVIALPLLHNSGSTSLVSHQAI